MTKDTHHLGSPDDTSMREYIITLNDHNDSDGFYEDMETEGGNITIPDRKCDVHLRRTISRNTHYKLTYDEARQVLEDERVLAVELTPKELGLVPVPLGWSMPNTSFNKRTASRNDDYNWGFVTSSSQTKETGWGDPALSGVSADIVRSITSQYSGKNVDVIIADDGTPYPSTLEYQQNDDGTGYTRLIQYNWFQHSQALGFGSNGVYDYRVGATQGEGRLQEHGAHTMGTTAGNTHGWARDANIYFMSFYHNQCADYVRYWHANKPINPETGIRNPTVMNNSWGYNVATPSWANVSEINIRGTSYYPTGSAGSYTWSSSILDDFWVTRRGTRLASVDADYVDLILAGVIVVASAGNDNMYIDQPGGLDYNNYYVQSGTTHYPHRGNSPGAAGGVINVGAAGSHNNTSGSVYTATYIEDNHYRAEFSNFGPGVDTWAAGAGIQSIWRTNQSLYDNVSAVDPRVAALGLTDTTNNNWKKCPGTSMSGPQVCGLMACLAEAFPRMTQAQAQAFLRGREIFKMDSGSAGRFDSSDLAVTSKNPDSCVRYAGQWNARFKDPAQGYDVPRALPSSKLHTPFRQQAYQANGNLLPMGQLFPRPQLMRKYNTTNRTYALSTSTTNIVPDGQANAVITLTTTNVPDGTEIGYIITSKYKGSGGGVTTVTDNGIYRASDSTNSYEKVITGADFGDGDGTGTSGEEKSHIIDISAAATDPTWIDDPAGFSYYDYNTAIDPNIAPAGTVTLAVGNSGASAYTFTGDDRVQTHTNAVDPVIVVNYGDTIDFTINSGASHPFYIKTTLANGGTSDAVTTGVTNNGSTSGTVSLDTTTVIDPDTGAVIDPQYGQLILYYQCSAHSSMQGVIIIRNRTTPTFIDETIENQKFVGGLDDGYWKFEVPWSFDTFGTGRDALYISTNSYITFGSGSTSYSNLTTLARDKLLLSAGDGRGQGIIHGIYGTAPNRFAFYDMFSNSQFQGNGNNTWLQLKIYENQPGKFFLSVLQNGRRTAVTNSDRYPFYQEQILGGMNTTGTFVVQNNTASITITPDSLFSAPSDQAMNVNVRLDTFNTPDVDFTVS
tara:strand:- start:104 stop:3307 length:3204 start_codon:yes stop_codon:yes gene_type:complete